MGRFLTRKAVFYSALTDYVGESPTADWSFDPDPLVPMTVHGLYQPGMTMLDPDTSKAADYLLT